MSQIAIRMGMEVVKEVTSATIAGNAAAWHPVGAFPLGTPLAHDAKMLIFTNFTDVDLMISDIDQLLTR